MEDRMEELLVGAERIGQYLPLLEEDCQKLGQIISSLAESEGTEQENACIETMEELESSIIALRKLRECMIASAQAYQKSTMESERLVREMIMKMES